jgi:hypothetical protein
MSVQLSLTDSSAVNPAGQGIATNATAAAAAAGATKQPVRPPLGQLAVLWRSGAPAGDGTLNVQITGAQQALGFLDQTAAGLQQLKAEVSARLAGKTIDPTTLANDVASFAAQWNNRGSASGGSLDADLNLSDDNSSRVGFRIRGLDFKSLQNGPAETLAFYPGGVAKPPLSVNIDAGMSQDALLARLNQALAPAGVQADAGNDGELTLSVAEANWPALADGLMIKGGGIRFPSGQPNRVRAQAQPGALDPSGWKTGDVAELRRTLQQIVDAIAKVEAARSRVRQALAQAQQTIEQAKQSSDAQWASEFAAQFSRTLNQPDNYSLFSSLSPALIGVSRYRVLSLLSLG